MLLRTIPRAAPRATTSTPLARYITSAARPTASTFTSSASAAPAAAPAGQQSRSAHAISNPTLAGIEKRWEQMPPQEQAELWMQLRDRMKVDWNELTLQEKKAAWWIAFGPHGPRALTPPGEWRSVFFLTAVGVAASAALFFGVHAFAKPAPKTMTKEWQEATNEYLKKENINPIYGISSEGYSGKGYVQKSL